MQFGHFFWSDSISEPHSGQLTISGFGINISPWGIRACGAPPQVDRHLTLVIGEFVNRPKTAPVTFSFRGNLDIRRRLPDPKVKGCCYGQHQPLLRSGLQCPGAARTGSGQAIARMRGRFKGNGEFISKLIIVQTTTTMTSKRSGLQILVHRFDSGPRLQTLSIEGTRT